MQHRERFSSARFLVPLVKARDFGNDASLVLSLDLKGDNFNLDACTYGGHVDLKLKVLKD